MNPSLERELDQILSQIADSAPLASEGSIRVAANMLSSAASCEVQATTVVGTLGRDDPAAVRTVAEDVAQALGLDVAVTIKVSSFCIKFSRPVDGGG